MACRGSVATGGGVGGVFFAEKIEFDGIVFEEEGDGPVEDDAKAAFPARHLHDVVGAPDPPSGEALNFEDEEARDAVVMAEGGEHAEGFVDEGFQLWIGGIGGLSEDDGEIVCEDFGFAEGVLCERRVGLSVGIGDGGAVSKGPDFGMLFGTHGGFDNKAAVFGFFEGEVLEQRIWTEARGEEDGFGFDDVVWGG